MTRAQLKTEVFRTLNASSLDQAFFTDTDVEDALDDGYREMSDDAEWNEQTITVDLLDDRPYYDARRILPSTVLSIGAAFNEQTNRWLTPTALIDLNRADRRWELVTGEPDRLLVRGLWWIGYWPRVQQDDGTIRQTFTALPDALEDDDEPAFPEAYHLGLKAYAVAELSAQAGLIEAALAAWETYLGYEIGLRQWVQRRAGVPMVRGYAGHAGIAAS